MLRWFTLLVMAELHGNSLTNIKVCADVLDPTLLRPTLFLQEKRYAAMPITVVVQLAWLPDAIWIQ